MAVRIPPVVLPFKSPVRVVEPVPPLLTETVEVEVKAPVPLPTRIPVRVVAPVPPLLTARALVERVRVPPMVVLPETMRAEVEAVPETESVVVVAWEVVALTAVKFWRVVLPVAMKFADWMRPVAEMAVEEAKGKVEAVEVVAVK